MTEAVSEQETLSTREGRWAYWKSHVEQWKRSGLSKQAYCREHGLKAASLYRWCTRLRDREKAKPSFIPVRLPSIAANGYALELELVDGRMLRIGADADPVWVSQLVRELERRC